MDLPFEAFEIETAQPGGLQIEKDQLVAPFVEMLAICASRHLQFRTW